MSRSIGLAHIIREDDGTSTGVWGAVCAEERVSADLRVRRRQAVDRRLRRTDPAVPRRRAPGRPGAFFNSIPAADRLHVETLTRTLHLLNAAACLSAGRSIFINFDPSVFIERAIADAALRDMRLVLHEAGIDPRRIVCEVTEQKSASQEALFALRGGAAEPTASASPSTTTARDDSDMNRIRELQPDIVKFDASGSPG